jgi:hypothetical protein
MEKANLQWWKKKKQREEEAFKEAFFKEEKMNFVDLKNEWCLLYSMNYEIENESSQNEVAEYVYENKSQYNKLNLRRGIKR